MRLISNWKAVALHSISMQAIYLGVLLLVVPELHFALTGRELGDPYVNGWLALTLLIGGGLGRLIDEGLQFREWSDGRIRRRRRIRWVLVFAVFAAFLLTGCKEQASAPQDTSAAQMPAPDAQFLALAVPFVGEWEGRRLEPYRDIVGVWTVCYGETKGVVQGKTYTVDECNRMFSKRLLEFRHGLHKHFTPETKATRLPVRRDVAFSSLAYNVGISGAGKSTAVRRLNAGQIAGACEALTWWNKAGGRVVRGLVRRRTSERDLCLPRVVA